MEERVDKFQFDVALIGCGAYGLRMAAFVKGLGKKTIHLGGLQRSWSAQRGIVGRDDARDFEIL